MPSNKKELNIIDRLENDISDTVGNQHSDELDTISSTFTDQLDNVLKTYNSDLFDKDGFVAKMREFSTDDPKDREVMRNVLSSIQSDYINIENLSQNELLLRRDIDNICAQMPEMRDAIYVTRDAIIECNVASGDVSRTYIFGTKEKTDQYDHYIEEIEKTYDTLNAIKNFIVIRLLKSGEFYIHVMPYSKLFAEVEALRESKSKVNGRTTYREYGESLYDDKNVTALMESVSSTIKKDVSETYHINEDIEKPGNKVTQDSSYIKEGLSNILKNIHVQTTSSELISEMGPDGLKQLLIDECESQLKQNKKSKSGEEAGDQHFMEALSKGTLRMSPFGSIDQEDIDISKYKDIKGCYVKYLDPLRVIPIRLDRKIIGYYYVTTTMDLQSNPAQPNGIVDLSYQHYMHDKYLAGDIADMIIRKFDRSLLNKNIKLKNEIADVLMAHKFSEGKLSFIYIPESEVVRFAINEDQDGKGHSMIEPTIFPARMHLMLTMYNMMYILNNNMTRIHYIKSSGLNKNYASQVQRAMRTFQSRRITMEDIYSYSGVLNKIGGMGEMVLPAGRGDYKAFETDTLEPASTPITTEFLEQQRRQALSGTGVPHLLVINALDEVDFAKVAEMGNTRFLSTATSYKIDCNRGITKWYQMLLRYSTDLDEDVIQSFRFMFNTVKQQNLNITAEMISNFNTMTELVENIYYTKTQLEDDNGNATPLRKTLRKYLAMDYLPQLEFEKLDKLVQEVETVANEEELQKKANSTEITDEDLEDIKK